MSTFLSTLGQIGYLFLIIIVGFIFAKACKLPDKSTAVLSRLESTIFMPSLIISNFMSNFTVSRLQSAWKFFLAGSIIIAVSLPAAYFVSRFTASDKYTRKIHLYSLAFANFGFMGTAVVSGLYPELFTDYLILVTPFWILNYGWSVSALLLPSDAKKGKYDAVKRICNPMFVGMIIGIILGITSVSLPPFVTSTLGGLSNCMSPVAMLITGMTVASINIKSTLKDVRIYILTFIRLLVIPLIFLGVCIALPIDKNVALCGLCALSMPLGLNTVVIPGAYGKDTSHAAGMAIVSHLLSALTIPLMITLYFMI